MMIDLVDIREVDPRMANLLTWRLLKERPPEANISHAKMPTYQEHEQFVASHPYAAWYGVRNEDNVLVGTVLLTKQNEIGIAILREHQRKGYARWAVSTLMHQHKPTEGKPGSRNGKFLANVSPGNHASQTLFAGLGGEIIQWTYRL